MRVLIVDDEYLLRQHICNTIGWEELGLTVVGEARDGEQALEQVEKLAPDIVLTDINMPNLDGVEFSKKMRSEYPDVCVIIITGYGEFEYAKEAINAGVFNYLLKPVDKEAYEQVLLEAKKYIFERRNQKNLAEAMEVFRKQKAVDYSLAYAFFEQGEVAEIIKLLDELDIKLSPDRLMVVVIRWESNGSLPSKRSLDNRSVQDILREELAAKVFDDSRCCLFEKEENEFVVVFNPTEDGTEEAALLEEVLACLESQHKINAYAGLSGIGNGFDTVEGLYMQAKAAQKQHFVLANFKVIVFNEDETQGAYSVSQYFDTDQMLINLRRYNLQGVKDCIDSVFEKMQKERITKSASQFTVLMLLSILNEFLMESNRSIGYTTNELMDEVTQKKNIGELWAFTNMLFEKTLDDVLVEVSQKKSEKVSQALEYIKEHYTENMLSLNTVSNALYINASYLSSIFKKEVGLPMVEFINQTRLAKAKEILDEDSKRSINEIAMAVGYSNEYYFMRCFKKHFGISPKTYVKNKKMS